MPTEGQAKALKLRRLQDTPRYAGDTAFQVAVLLPLTPWEAALGRLTAAFRPGRTRFPCVPPAAGTLVLLAVELSCVAMVIPGPSRLTV